MNHEVQVLLDKQAILEVLHTYCRGVDRCDEALVRSVYHDDAYDDHGYWRGRGQDFASFVVKRLMAANSATTHSITNVLICVEGDRAWSESQVMATLVRRGEEPLQADVMGARYLDRLSRRDGTWRIEHRVVVLDWNKVESWKRSNEPIALDAFLRGGRAENDPLHVMRMNGRLPERGTLGPEDGATHPRASVEAPQR